MSVLSNSIVVLMLLVSNYSIYGQKSICGNESVFIDSTSRAKIKSFDREIVTHSGILNSRSEIVIPIVIHVVWNKQDENLSDGIILSQIDAINKDFNAKNIDIKKIPYEFKSSFANSSIRFCLAAIDPRGNPTTGIIRVSTTKKEIGLIEDLFYSTKQGSDAWDTEKYLNIWIANTGNVISGFGSYPNQTLPEKTGVIIHPMYFGMNGQLKYGLGRTTTHEIGHYLGLKHLWGDDANCDTDDDVSDTPVQKSGYRDCPNYPQKGCSSSEMFMNFMDYVDDPCMFMFTKGQKERMLSTIRMYRKGLLLGTTACSSPSKFEDNKLMVYPNPSSGLFYCKDLSAQKSIKKYILYNSIGQYLKKDEMLVNNDDELEINISVFPSGIYFMEIDGKFYKLIKI